MGSLPPLQGGQVLQPLLAQAVPAQANPGLVFDRYLKIWSGSLAAPEKSAQLKSDLDAFVGAYNSPRPELASLLVEHQARLDRQVNPAWRRTYKSAYRVALGLGTAHPLENGFLFDHSLGVPYLPGSALKGVLRAYLTLTGRESDRDRLLGREGDSATRTGTAQGQVVFLPAYPKTWPKLAVDVINSHHPDYYGEKRKEPVDWENPVPVFFLVLETGVEFVCRLSTVPGVPEARRDAIVEEAYELLEEALSTLGVGAKTAVGYGVMQTLTERPKSKKMSTDIAGKFFVSYRRDNAPDAKQMLEALHEVGLCTWRDVDDLQVGQTETQIRETLARAHCSGAVLLATNEVEQSHFIRDIEAPLILDRARRDKAFRVAIVAIGLEYGEVERVLGTASSLTGLAGQNMFRCEAAPLSHAVAADVARKVLSLRVAAVAEALPASAPLRIDVGTRVPPATYADVALSLNYTHLFDGRLASADSWNTRILPALRTLRGELAKALRSSQRSSSDVPSIELSGQVTISMAVALGTTFLSTSELGRATWLQPRPGASQPERWSAGLTRAESHFRVLESPDATTAKHLALLVSVGQQPVEADFRRYRSQLPPLRAVVSIEPSERSPGQLTAETALDVCLKTIDALKAARKTYGADVVHLFFAGPVGLAFLLGQQLNTFSLVHTYEHVGSAGELPYIPAAALRPSE